ncbi:integrase core domain-containing protein [Nonomuraea endophytica]|uniref:integrase core domain-containing protein n=1 Tax=Nonomuraea endophytica TaxID=714136 RepID=UPI0037C55E75
MGGFHEVLKFGQGFSQVARDGSEAAASVAQIEGGERVVSTAQHILTGLEQAIGSRHHLTARAAADQHGKQFLIAQAEHVVAAGFLHVDTINLKRIYALVLLEHRSRRTHLLDVTANPTSEWAPGAYNFLMDTDTTNMKCLIRDRAGQFTVVFDTVFADAGLRVLKSPPQAPKANAHCERMIGTMRHELLDRALILNEPHLRRNSPRYLEHYNTARPHPGIGQLSPSQAETGPPSRVDLASHRVHCRTIFGGLINEYQIAS